MDNKMLQKLKRVAPELKWEAIFIAYPHSQRCLCVPFSGKLNRIYEKGVEIEEELERQLRTLGGD